MTSQVNPVVTCSQPIEVIMKVANQKRAEKVKVDSFELVLVSSRMSFEEIVDRLGTIQRKIHEASKKDVKRDVVIRISNEDSQKIRNFRLPTIWSRSDIEYVDAESLYDSFSQKSNHSFESIGNLLGAYLFLHIERLPFDAKNDIPKTEITVSLPNGCLGTLSDVRGSSLNGELVMVELD